MKKFLFGICVGIVLTLSTAAYASDSIQALLFPAKIKINGQDKKLDSEYQILNVNGHAYVPIRYVAENTDINIGYDDDTQTILLAYGNKSIKDMNNNDVSVSDLIATSYDKNIISTKVTGHLSLNTNEAKYVNASIEFYDTENKLLGTVTIDDDFKPGMNLFDVQSSNNLTSFSSIKLKVRDVHPALKSTVSSLFDAAKSQDSERVQKILDSVPTVADDVLLLDFMKWSVPYSNELRSLILPSILKKTPNVNIQEKANGYTALMYASSFAIEQIKPLIESGADVKIKANDGTTALLLLTSKRAPDLVKLLLDKGPIQM
ncbi:hypothetical protein LJK88_06540 [Paenibacillus sp. P26]|nr:hypothetical protein LJK88_06540 [Paenibacillus sp. P26]UUZ90347.1 hypothetical protein LJK87_30990 [Paenibacillus sp. P25]